MHHSNTDLKTRDHKKEILFCKAKSFLWMSVLVMGLILLFSNKVVSNTLSKKEIQLKNKITLKTPEVKPLFFKTGTNMAETFTAVQAACHFDVVNRSKSHLMLVFIGNPEVLISPTIVRLSPGTRQNVIMKVRPGVESNTFSYALALSSRPYTIHPDRYRAYNDGETEMCIPVNPEHYALLMARTVGILNDSKTEVTDKAMPPSTFIYTPGPFYRKAGIFARDFLYQLEGSGRDIVTAEEIKLAVDFHALKQLKANRKVGPFTYPKGAIPDHIYPDGQFSWGPGEVYGDTPAHFHRPSMDEAMCFVTLGWHYGYKAGWDADWKAWFSGKSQCFADAWNSIPRNAENGLITQWSTPGHIGANDIKESNGACVMWGFHDSYGFGGDDLGTSVLACNAARALADMHEHSGNKSSAKSWEKIADDMRDAIRAQFNLSGYLPWGVGQSAPTMASPDITGYAVWSGILTDEQADAASDWLAERYKADKVTGGAADLFHMSSPFRGAVRMARKTNDVSPDRHVWPDMSDGNHWENLAFGYNAYQDGGYWYYMSLGVAVTLWRRHPDLAREWVSDAYADLAGADAHHPYERIDGMKPVNDRYNASVGSLMGIGMPAEVLTVKINMRE